MRLQLKYFALSILSVALSGDFAAQADEAPSVDASAPPKRSDIDVRASSELATYADTDHVFVQTPSIAATFSKPTAGWTFGAHYLVDVVSAASVDIVSTASRRWEEVRQTGGADLSYKPGNFGIAANVAFSTEPDYLSLAGGMTLSWDVLHKNATLLGGYGFSHDVAGRTDTPFSIFSHLIDTHSLKAGSSFVLDSRTIMTLLADVGIENGDTSKPYRYIPLFAPGTPVPRGAPIDLVNEIRTSARPLEQLPTSRQRYAITGRLAHRFDTMTLRLDERLYTDNWGLNGTTTDVRWLFDIGRTVELGPHGRLHGQTPVSFWSRAYTLGAGLAVPALRTGDRELGPLYNITGGFTTRLFLGPAAIPQSWVLGLDINLTSTQYLDDLYTTSRISALGAVTLEAGF